MADDDPLLELVRSALAEDLGVQGDVTTRVSVPAGARGRAVIRAKQAGVLSGVEVARCCFRHTDSAVEFGRDDLREGASLEVGSVVATLHGNAAALLAAERTALNFLQRMSGIATRTAEFVAAVSGTGARILDTRKTTPTLRVLERAAVRAGGGCNHRFGLFDAVLLKENHFAFAGRDYRTVVADAVAGFGGPVIAEAETVEQGLLAVEGGAAVVLLDNFEPGEALRAAAAALRRRAGELGRRVEIEASGGVRLENVRQFAECGVDRISVGALTHSVEALDLSMRTEALP
ncbi:MAG: carboxylating nicotinate-nucleotide diphosphorylase [Planctomycetes bacterium]|nr:carboxylating nicotinate-nucleotide diphosphorylase [Planctomycetota bacterium]MCB9889409.1 carboxylating nicotinate-nucleotide diphosphorylase [Planctomycetota bacterium]